MKTHTKLLIALLTALLLAAGCGSDDDADMPPAVEYKVMGGRLVWCSGGAEDMVVPVTASSIGNNAFSNCGTIGTLTIPASVTHIMRYTFSCVKIGKIIFGGTVAEWANMAEQDGFGETLRGTPVICSDGEWRWTAPAVPDVPVKPDEWEITDGVLIRYTGNAADVTVPGGVTAIAGDAFAGCTSLTHVTIPKGVTEIRADAFKDCTSLAGVTLPDSVTTIGENAFAGCASLAHADIPASVETVGAGAIPAGTTVTYRGTAERWDEFSADGGLDDITVFITDGGTLTGYRGSATDITIPDGVTAIAGGVFAGHTELEHISIPAGVTGIVSSAFVGSGITEIEYKGDLTAWDALVEAGGIADEVADITVRCADGSWTLTHTHEWGAYTDGGDGTHRRTCAGCGRTESATHEYGGETYTSEGHTKTCAGCGHSETAPHTWSGTYTDGGAGGHHKTCTTAGCNAHSTTTPHTWDGATHTSAGGHYQLCTAAGCAAHSATEAHTFGGTPQADGDSGHYQSCTTEGCDARSATEPHGYTYATGGSTTHTMTCPTCNHTKTEPHAYGGETYTDAGHTKTCAGCGHSETAQHTWSNAYADGGTGGHYRTCTTAGCNAHSPAEAHTYGAYTDDNDGFNHSQTCSVCNRTVHGKHKYGAYTDDGNGNHHQTCSDCGHTKSESHAYGGESFTDAGHTKTCTGCGHAETTQHAWGNAYTNGGDSGHYQTCTTAGCNAHSPAEAHQYGTTYTNDNNGKHHQTCSVCAATKTEAHTYGTTWTDAGNGYHKRACSACAATQSTAHTYGSETYTDEGHVKTCTACTATKTEEHTYGTTYTSSGKSGHYRTCTAAGCDHTETEAHAYAYTDNGDGTQQNNCTRCDYSVRALHAYDGDVCKDCGYPKPVMADGTIDDTGTLTKYTGSAAAVEIPYGVTRIGNSAFKDCTSLTSVTIPNTAMRIDAYAFMGCTSLTSVTIPASVTYIRDETFRDCTSLTSVTYRGTKAQWDAINKERPLTGMTIICTDGTLTL